MIDLSHARRLVVEADIADLPIERFSGAYRCAEQVALAVVTASPRRGRGRADVWTLLVAAAPELGEWGGYFAAIAPRALAAEAGVRGVVGEREAADLVRDAQQFLLESARWLRLRERDVAGEAS